MDYINRLILAAKAQKKTLRSITFLVAIISIPIPFLDPTIYDHLLKIEFIILFICLFIFIINVFKENEELNLLASSNGRLLDFKEIKKLKTTKKIALIGLSSSGKTTFINKLGHLHSTNIRTQEISGKIIKLKGKELCFIDISGEKLVQQFQVLEFADVIIFIVDHSDSNSAKIKRSRIDNTKKLLKTLKDHWDSLEHKKTIPSIVLINKKDLWIRANPDDKCQLLQEYNEPLYHTVKELFGNVSKIYEYSNKDMSEKSNKIVELNEIIDFIIENTRKH